MDLGIQTSEKINLLSGALLQLLSFPTCSEQRCPAGAGMDGASSASSWQQPTGPTPHPLPRLNSKAVGEVTNTRSEGQMQGKTPSRNVDSVCYLHSGGEEEGTTSHALGCMPQQFCSLLTWARLTHNLKAFTNYSQVSFTNYCTSTRTHR